MVLVHEYGHYIAAKTIGVKVEEFAIGFGPKIVGWKRGETEYKWCWLPLGGYVKMLGEEPGEDTEKAGDDPRAYNNRKRWERFIILLAGPVFNLILAYLLWVLMMVGGQPKNAYLVEPPVVGHVMSGLPAEEVGILPGDRVVSVNGEEMKTWEDLIFKVAVSPREELTFVVDREGKELVFTMQPVEEETRGGGSVGLAPYISTEVGAVTEGSPADLAGVQVGDVITAIGDTTISSYQAVQEMMLAYTEDSGALQVTVDRNGIPTTMMITPEKDEEVDMYLLGIRRNEIPMVTVSHGLGDALVLAGNKCVEMSSKLFEVLGKLFSGMISPKAISGPIEIAAISGAAAQQGIMTLINLMAFISLNLGIVNLLPIPVMDGGQILILGVEGTLRRDLNMQVKEWIMRIGVALLLMLMAFIIFQDVMKLVGG